MFVSGREVHQRRRKLRNNPTEAEKRLWFVLRKRGLCGYKFRRQCSVGRYIVDFFCPHIRLVIEVDGSQHYESRNIAYDEQRTKYLESLNIKVVRVTNAEVVWRLEEVIDFLVGVVKERSSTSEMR